MTRPSRRLAWANRQILADRLGWPVGALQQCERIESAYPDWSVTWLRGNTVKGFESPPRFWAVRDGRHRYEVTAPDPAGLEQAIRDAPPAEHNYGI
jgi:hypothetical protein